MTSAQLRKELEQLLALPAETEWVEFKEAKNNLNFDELGQYFSALSNEANLKGRECAWLILGIRNNPRAVVGSQYRPSRKALDSLKHEVAKQTTNRITFIEIYEVSHPNGRVLMFQVPPATRGMCGMCCDQSRRTGMPSA